MPPGAIEQNRVSLAGYHDLNGRPAFKIGIQEQDGRWYLYLGHFWDNGWSVLDVTDPANVEYLTFIEGPENTSTGQVQVADGLLLTALEKSRGYDGDDFEEGTYVWDVASDPENPERLGHYRTGEFGTHRNFYVGGEYAYMATRLADAPVGYSYLPEIVDVSDPTSPTEVTRWWWPGQHPDDDVEPDEHFFFHGPMYVQDDRAYLSYGRVGVVVLDVEDVSDPSLVGRLGFGDLGSWLGVHSAIPIPDTDLLAVNTETIREESSLEGGDSLNFTALVDVSDPTTPAFDVDEPSNPDGMTVLSTMPVPTPEDGLPYDNYHEKPGRYGPHNQAHYRDDGTRLRTSDYLFMTYFNAGLRVFDISDPLAPTEAGYYVPEDPETRIGSRPETGLTTQFEDVVVDKRGYVYCTDKNHGLHVLETDLA